PGAFLTTGAKHRRHFRNCRSVVARFGRAVVYARSIAHDGLSPAQYAASGSNDLQLVPKSCEFLPNVCGHKRLDIHVASLERSFREPARFKGLLNVETEVGDMRHELRVRLRLIKAAHDAETDSNAILFHKCGNDRM